MRNELNCIYRNIKTQYEVFENMLNRTFLKDYNNQDIINRLIMENNQREILNHFIRDYISLGGKRDITKYCKYYC